MCGELMPPFTVTQPVLPINDGTDATSYSFASFTPPDKALLIVFAFVTGETYTLQTTVDGGGLAWTREEAEPYVGPGADIGYLFWARVDASPGPITVTIREAGGSPAASGCTAFLFQVTGAHHANPVRQTAAAHAATANPTVNLGLSILADSCLIAGFGMNAAPPGGSPPLGWTDDGDIAHANPLSGAFVAHRIGGESGSAVTFTCSRTLDHAILAIEIRPAVRWEDQIAPTTQASCGIDTCDYQSFSGSYEADWAAVLAKHIGIDHRVVVCVDPDGLALQLTGMVASMRPLVMERDVKFQEYQGQDIDIEFVDPYGVLDPAVAGSVFEGVTWKGLPVFIGSWIVGTAKVLAHAIFYLQDIRAADGKVTFRCADAFGRLKGMQVRANEASDGVVSCASSTGIGATVTVFPAFAAIETWTVTFLSATHFKVEGSATGLDGEGDTTALFSSISGSIQLANDWAGVWAAGDTFEFKAVAHRWYPENIFALAQNMLINNTDLVAADFEATSWAAIVADHPSHVGSFTQRDPIDALSLLRIFMRHGPVTAYPNHEGKIAVAYFHPRLGTTTDGTVCNTVDLESLDTERLDYYSSVTVKYAPNATDGTLTAARRWPSGSPGNYPLEIELPGFSASQESLMDFIAQRYYALFHEQRELFNVDLLLQSLNRKLEDVVWLKSGFPNRQTYGQFIRLDKDLARDQIQAQLLDVGWLIQAPGSCGYAFCDAGHRCDDCWVCW